MAYKKVRLAVTYKKDLDVWFGSITTNADKQYSVSVGEPTRTAAVRQVVRLWRALQRGLRNGK